MGTNYYRVNIPTEDQIKQMHEMIDKHLFNSKRGYYQLNGAIPDDAITCVQELIEEATKEVHICKMSFGWKTCFDHNWGRYYKPSRKELEEFLSEPNTVIKDEYGDTISFNEFWETVGKRDKTLRSDGGEPFTSKTYNEWERNQGNEPYNYLCKEDISKCRKKFGVKPNSNDFEVDNLRFAVYSGFS